MIEKFMNRIADFVVKFPAIVIIICVAFSILTGIFVKNLELDNDMMNWVNSERGIGKLPHYIDKRFGGITPLLIIVEADEIFEFETLTAIREISRIALETDGVDTVMSITETVDITADDDSIIVDDLIKDEIPSDTQSLLELKEYVLNKGLYRNRLVSQNSKAAMVLIKINSEAKSDIITYEIRDKVNAYVKDKDLSVIFGGMPAIMNSISEVTISNLKFLVPSVIILLLGILFLSFRTIRGVVLPLVSVVLITCIAMGLMGITGAKFSMLGAAIPVILIAVGSAYGIHFMNKYYEESSKEGLSRRDIVYYSIREVGIPILMAGVTTFIGFLSLLISDLNIIQSFGAFIAIGVIFALFFALTFIPAILSRIKIRKRDIKFKIGDRDVDPGKWSLAGSSFIVKHSKWIVLGFIIIAVVAIGFTLRIRAEMDYLAYFDSKAEPNRVARIVNDNFGGFSPFSIYLKADIQNADIQKLMLMIEEYVKAGGEMAAVGGIHNIIAELNDFTLGIRTIPETDLEISHLWFFIEGRDYISSYVTSDKSEAIIGFMLPSVSTEFEHNFYTPIGDYLSLFDGNFNAVKVSPANPRVIDLVTLMIENLYRDEGLEIDGDFIREFVTDTARAIEDYSPQFPSQRITDYLLGDFSEIEFRNPALVRNIINGLSRIEEWETDAVFDYMLNTLPQSKRYDEYDIELLSESIFVLVRDYRKSDMLDKAIDSANKNLPPKLNRDKLRYALSVFLWESIPAPADTEGDILRTVDIERLELSGNSYLFYLINNRLTFNQLYSMLIALAAVFLLNAFTFKSFKISAISLCPIIFTLLVNFGIMGIFDITLDVVSVTIASIAIGIGIDYTIHFVKRYVSEFNKARGDKVKALSATLSTTGQGIVFNAASVGLGFLVLIFSDIVPLRTLGAMLAVSMFVSSVSAMVLLPCVFNGTLSKSFMEKQGG